MELNGPLFGPLYEPVEEFPTRCEQIANIIEESETLEEAAERIIEFFGGSVEEPEEPEMPKDLEWLAMHLKTIPSDCHGVSLDYDGEVRFAGADIYNYYPEEELEADRYGTFGDNYYTLREVYEARAKLKQR